MEVRYASKLTSKLTWDTRSYYDGGHDFSLIWLVHIKDFIFECWSGRIEMTKWKVVLGDFPNYM